MRRHFSSPRTESRTSELIASVRRIARPLDSVKDLDPLLERIGNARYVFLGEASHGTADHYVWRAKLSQRLIREKGFSFIAVEGDWPDCYRVNRYVKNYAGQSNGALPGNTRPSSDWRGVSSSI
jgi:erythromycin esterase